MITFIFIVLSAFIFMCEIIGKVSTILGKPVSWVKKKNEDHALIIKTNDMVTKLERELLDDKRRSDECDNDIKKDVEDIRNLLKEHIETDKKNTRATFRSSLYRMHSDFTSQGFITKEGLKTFLECGKAYEKADGDDIYHDKLKPEIMKLPIKEVDKDGNVIDDI